MVLGLYLENPKADLKKKKAIEHVLFHLTMP